MRDPLNTGEGKVHLQANTNGEQRIIEISMIFRRISSQGIKRSMNLTTWYWTVFVRNLGQILTTSKISRSTWRLRAISRATACGLQCGQARIAKMFINEWRWTRVSPKNKIWYSPCNDKWEHWYAETHTVCRYRVTGNYRVTSPGHLKFRPSLFSLRSGHPDFIFPDELSHTMESFEFRVKKQQISSSLLITNALYLFDFLSQHDRLDDTLHRHRRHHGDRQHVVKLAVLWHISRTEISTSLNLKMDQGVPKTWFRSPCVFSFSSTIVPQMAENTVHKWGDRKFSKKHFCEVHFSLGEKQILETRCIKQHAFFGRSTAWFICFFFECSHFDVIWPTKKGGSNQERRTKLRSRVWSRVEISITRTSQKGPIPGG